MVSFALVDMVRRANEGAGREEFGVTVPVSSEDGAAVVMRARGRRETSSEREDWGDDEEEGGDEEGGFEAGGEG